MQLQLFPTLNGTRFGTFLQTILYITGVPLFQDNLSLEGFSRSSSAIFRNLEVEGPHPDDPLNTRCYGVLGCITVKYPEQRGFHLFPEPLSDIKPNICLYTNRDRVKSPVGESTTSRSTSSSSSSSSSSSGNKGNGNGNGGGGGLAGFPTLQFGISDIFNLGLGSGSRRRARNQRKSREERPTSTSADADKNTKTNSNANANANTNKDKEKESGFEPEKCRNKVDTDDIDSLVVSNAPGAKAYWITHGYIEDANRPWVHAMVNELLEQDPTANVFVVDWSRGSEPPYMQAVVNLELVAAYTAHLMLLIQDTHNLNVSQSHWIGHSLGAHFGGFVGSWIQRHSDFTLARISGLDPAQPYFQNYPPDARLDSSDAELVDVIHTDAKPLLHGGSLTGLGTQQPTGHVDFFPNSGKDQPGCHDGVYSSILAEDGSLISGLRRFIGCDHIRSYEYFTESIRSSCSFMSFACTNWDGFLASECPIDCSNQSSVSQCNRMGFHAKKPTASELSENRLQTWQDGLNSTKTAAGSILYYSITASRAPYCRQHYQVSLNLAGVSVLRALTDLNLVVFGPKRSVRILNLGERDLRGNVSHKFVVAGPPIETRIERAILKPSSSNPLWWLVNRMARVPDIAFQSISISNLERGTTTTLCPEGKPHLTMSERNPHILLTTNACLKAPSPIKAKAAQIPLSPSIESRSMSMSAKAP